jgi:hypothetical protein
MTGSSSISSLLVEAESFANYGGWVLDSQFDLVMGSPYLLAHGNGTPVADAITSVPVPAAGVYHVWVRAKDWVPDHHPGRFSVIINGKTLDTTFGANNRDWSWESGGQIKLSQGETEIVLHDLTGFCGRCDAIFLSTDATPPPEAVDERMRAWRRRLRGFSEEPVDIGDFDVVVIGGGVTGIAAALTAARLGERVALVQDRPYLGGNASVEIGLSPRGTTGPMIKEISARQPGGDLRALQLLQAEPQATVLMEHKVYAAATAGSKIVSIDARHARSGREVRLRAPTFIDCSGQAIFGLYTDAETLFGQEARDEYGEPLAPAERSAMHHGHTVFFRTRLAESPVSFPPVPWATEVAKDYSDLGGQLMEPGFENGPGPRVASPDRVNTTTVPKLMTLPLTHFWEYGQWLDPYVEGERIRDHLLRAIYGTFANVKAMEPEKFANLGFEWVAFVPAQGEFRRYKGDYVLAENDIREHRAFPDAVVQNEGAFCLHYPGNEKYDFRLGHWDWDERDGKPYDIPFRCLYSRNVTNLMMAGKHISATHVASSNVKFMGNGGQHGIATGAAAYLCRKYSQSPRGIYQHHMPELRSVVKTVSESRLHHSRL